MTHNGGEKRETTILLACTMAHGLSRQLLTTPLLCEKAAKGGTHRIKGIIMTNHKRATHSNHTSIEQMKANDCNA